MSLPKLAIEKQPVTYFAVLLLVAAGVFCYFQLGQLEDPEFTVKTASVITAYPGASAEQVELEVTDLIETKLQEMPELKNIRILFVTAATDEAILDKARNAGAFALIQKPLDREEIMKQVKAAADSVK